MSARLGCGQHRVKAKKQILSSDSVLICVNHPQGREDFSHLGFYCLLATESSV